MLNPSAIKATLGFAPAEDLAKSGTLKVGDRLTVKVLKADGGNVLVALGRLKIPALVDFAVKGGDRIQVVVAGLQRGQVRLHLVEGLSTSALSGRGMELSGQPEPPEMDLMGGGQRSSVTRDVTPLTMPLARDIVGLQGEIMEILLSHRSPAGNRPNPADVFSALSRIIRNVGPLPLESGSARLAPQIAFQVENYGIFFEKKLETLIAQLLKGRHAGPLWDRPEIRLLMDQDMKPNLLRLQQAFGDLNKLVSGSAWRKTGPARQLLEGLLADIERQQGRAVQLKSAARSLQEPVYSAGAEKTGETARPDAGQVFTYQFNLPDNDSSVRLKVYYASSKRRKARQGNRLSLLLSMGRIGEIRTDFFLLQGNLDITFYVRSEEVKTLVEGHLPHFTPAVEALFAGLNIKVLVSEPRVATFETQDWIRPGDKLVDYRV